MPQIKKSYTEVAIPFQKMTFTPDVPSSALGANEYNDGINVETDVRGIRSVNGDEYRLIYQGKPEYDSYYLCGIYDEEVSNNVHGSR